MVCIPCSLILSIKNGENGGGGEGGGGVAEGGGWGGERAFT